MRRLISIAVLALVALVSVVSGAAAATKAPVITSVSPSNVKVGQRLIIKGKYFKKGVKKNRVFFTRASDGKTVRARPSKANSTKRMEVIVPAGVANFLTIRNGVAQPTRFAIQVLSGKFSKRTARSKSPVIYPANATSVPGSTGTTTGGTTTQGVSVTPPPPPDTDGDGIPDSSDPDIDNDGLPNALETQIHTDPYRADTDGDGIGDAYEYYSALDLNGNALPYPGTRPYPNALDASDANKDFDGDGLTMAEEYAAWQYLGRPLPAGPAQTFPYSDGNQYSTAPLGLRAMDLNENGRISDDEKDADNDGLPNWLELAKTDATPVPGSGCTFVDSTNPQSATLGVYTNIFTDCGAGPMPNGNTFTGMANKKTAEGAPEPPYTPNPLNWLNPDSDGDGVRDDVDDQDFDGVSNIEEITTGSDGWLSAPQDPCDPNTDSPTCPLHPAHT